MKRSMIPRGRPGSGSVSSAAALAAVLLGAVHLSAAQNGAAPGSPAAKTAAGNSAYGVLQVQRNVYIIAGAESNLALQVGPEGVLLVDSGAAGRADAVLTALRGLSDQPIRWIVNTSADPAHVSGNEALSKAGLSTAQNAFGSGRAFPGSLPTGATIVAHENVLMRMANPGGGMKPWPSAAWPVATFIGDGRELYLNDDPIQVFHEPKAVTDGDSIVFFRHSDVVATGDVFVTTGYPPIDVGSGGTINGTIAALNHILDITIPRDKQEGGTYVIPGRGRVSDEADVVTYRNMVTIIRDRVLDLARKGRTLAQIKATKPTADFDGRWSNPSWTGDMFVEAVFRTLPSSPLPRK